MVAVSIQMLDLVVELRYNVILRSFLNPVYNFAA